MKILLVCLAVTACTNGHAIIKHSTSFCGSRRVLGGFELCLKVSCL